MSCGPTSCPPAIPSPQARPTWDPVVGVNCQPDPVFYNTEQTYVDSCGGESPTPDITVTVPPYTYTSTVSQEDADDTALAAAQAEAEALRELSPCQEGSGDFIVTEDGDFLVTEDGDFIIT